MAERSLGKRLAVALLASGVMLALLLALVWIPSLRALPDLVGVENGTGRGLVLELPIAVAVLLLTHRLAGLANVGLSWRGAGTSLALSIPVLLLSFADAKPSAFPPVAALLGPVVLALFVGLVEEVYGRGLLVTLLGGRRHAILAIAGSSVLFAYLHMPIYVHRHGLADALLRCTGSAAFSAVFATIRLRSGSLAGPIAFHAINDAQFLLAGAGASGTAPASFRPIVAGAITTLLYWVACQRAIADAAIAERTNAANAARGA